MTYTQHSWPLSSEGSLVCHRYSEKGQPFIRWSPSRAFGNGTDYACFNDLVLFEQGSNTDESNVVQIYFIEKSLKAANLRTFKNYFQDIFRLEYLCLKRYFSDGYFFFYIKGSTWLFATERVLCNYIMWLGYLVEYLVRWIIILYQKMRIFQTTNRCATRKGYKLKKKR